MIVDEKTDDCRIVASGADAVRMLCCFDSPTEMNESVKETRAEIGTESTDGISLRIVRKRMHP